MPLSVSSPAKTYPSGSPEILGNRLLVDLVREHVADLVAVIDSSRQRIWHNDAYSTTLGYTREELAGADSHIQIHPDDLTRVSEAFERAMRTGETQAMDYRMGRKDGRWLLLESQARVVDLPECGRCLVLVARDITETRRLEAQLKQELSEGARYVRSLLPPEIEDHPLVRAHWDFFPCTLLGGDTFGYQWIDEDHFAFGLVDVCGHGIGAALLSISVVNVMRSRSLADTDFTKPDEVLEGLNRAFPMEDHGNRFFTMWFGVYHCPSRTLTYGNAGHPAPVLFTREGSEPKPRNLEGHGPVVGMIPGAEYRTQSVPISPGSVVYVFSDGLFELEMPDGSEWPFEEFVEALSPGREATPQEDLDRVLERCREVNGKPDFDDDYSLLRVSFP